MFHSPYLDLITGLAVIFFLCSLVVSGLNEGLNWLTRVRAKFLWAYLHDLFDPERGKALPQGFGAITNLWGARNDKRPSSGGGSGERVDGVVGASSWLSRLAYALDPIDAPQLLSSSKTPKSSKSRNPTSIKNIPAASLAHALVEVFSDVGRQEIESALSTILDPTADPMAVTTAIDRTARGVDSGASAPVSAAFTAFRSALVAANGAADQQAAADGLTEVLLRTPNVQDTPGFADALRAAALDWPSPPSAEHVRAAGTALLHAFPTGFTRQRIENALTRVGPKSPLYPTLRRLWEAAMGDVDRFRKGIESYFDGELQRLSGYYRRSIRIVVFGLAVLVAAAGAVDTFSITRSLWRNPGDRAVLLQQADQLAESGSATSDPTTPGALEGIQEACRKAHPSDNSTISNPDEAAAAYAKVRTCVSDALDHLTGLGVIDHAVWVDAGGWADDWSNGFVGHAAGVLLTALALTLGAPFWFDLIKRLTGVRKGLVGDT
jgi:hypothetical protein